MSQLDQKIYKIKPVYLDEFDELIKRHSQFGGGASESKFVHAKSFSNVYEFYIYAFFIGLYNNVKVEIVGDDKTKTFWEMENWKPKELVDYLIVCAIAASEFDMVGIEQLDDSKLSEHVKLLKKEIEKYANGGFRFISDMLDREPDLIDDDTLFIRLLSETKA